MVFLDSGLWWVTQKSAAESKTPGASFMMLLVKPATVTPAAHMGASSCSRCFISDPALCKWLGKN